MKRSTSSSLMLGMALALSVVNIGLLIVGIQWAQDVRTEILAGSEGAAEAGVARADARAMNALRAAAWSACLLGGGLLLVLTLRQWKRVARAEREDGIRSYTRNVARANRQRR